MIWFAFLIVSVMILLPLAWVIAAPAQTRGRRETALALHYAQLDELDRELAEGRLLRSEHRAARVEVQRRLLAEAALVDRPVSLASPWPLIYSLLLIPAAALGLYLVHGQPGLPATPLAARQREWAAEDRLINLLKARLEPLPQGDPRSYEGYILLGDAELQRNRLADASNAWIHALEVRFNPQLAAQAAEARAESLGRVDRVAASLFKRALASAPADAPWYDMVQQRLEEAVQ